MSKAFKNNNNNNNRRNNNNNNKPTGSPTSPNNAATATESNSIAQAATSVSNNSTIATEELKMTLFARSKGGAHFVSMNSNLEESLHPNTKKFIVPPIGGNFGDCQSAVSPCGVYIAFADDQRIYVHTAEDGKRVFIFEAPRCINLMWSPKSTFLVCFAHHDAVRSADNNLSVFRVTGNGVVSNIAPNGTVTGSKIDPVLRCGQAFWPALSWTADENFCARRSKTSVVCVKGDLSDLTPMSTLNLQIPAIVGKEASLSIAGLNSSATPSLPLNLSAANNVIQPPFLALFVPQIKQQVAAIHVYRLPDLTNPVMSRPFGRGDRASIKFSPSGTSFTVVVSCDDDKTGSSYYGSTQCFLVDISTRNSEQIPLSTGEGVHDCQWSPVADEFILVHGIMPRNKATLFNGKGQKLFAFSEEPRNVVYWSPSGQAIALGGNAGLPGDYAFYSREAINKVGNAGMTNVISAMNSVQIGKIHEKSSHQMWLPDSRHFVTMNIFTTLRVDNKFTVWKYTGEKVAEEKFPEALFAVHCAVPIMKKKDSMLKGGSAQPGPWMRPYNSPIKDQAKVQQKAEAWKPRHASSAAAALLASSAPRGGAGDAKPAGSNPVGSGPVGAQVVVTKKKGGRR